MYRIPQSEVVDNLALPELAAALEGFLAPLLVQLPDKRLHAVATLMVRGILGGQSPLISQMARGVERAAATIRPQARRMYRFVWNERFSHRELLKGLYGVAQKHVAHQPPGRLVVALDPVNLEKCYTEKLEGISTVLKSTPPGPEGKRLTSGYPALTATIVNLPEPVVTYANWFSYETKDFVSENRELYRALRITRALFPEQTLCFAGDAGLDDQSNIRIASTKKTAWTWKMCACKPWNVCAACLSWFYSRPCLFITSTTRGRRTRSSGYGVWVVNSASPPMPMAPMSYWRASRLFS